MTAAIFVDPLSLAVSVGALVAVKQLENHEFFATVKL